MQLLTKRNLGALQAARLVSLCMLAALSIARYEGVALHGSAFLAVYFASMLVVIIGIFTSAFGLWKIQKTGRPVFDSASAFERIVWIGGSLVFFVIVVAATINLDSYWSQAFQPLMTGLLAVPTLAQLSVIRRLSIVAR